MFTAGQAPLPRRRVLAAGALGITTTTLPAATASASSLALTAETAVSSVTVTASEAGTFTATWDDSAGFTHDLVLQRTDGTAETLTDVSSPLTVTPSDWTATDDGVVYAVYVASRSGDTTLNSAPSNVTLRAAASGGSVTTITGDGSAGTVDGAVYRVHTFTAGGTLSVAHARSVEYLLVGGGGGGGTRHGGGGGGGGVLTGTTSLTVGDAEIVVGTGGTGMSQATLSGAGSDGADGGDTTAFGLTADGGGRGGGTRHGPSDGGSGGGSDDSGTSAGAATSGQGSAGGDGVSGSSEGGYAGGGGGGAGGAGGDASGGGDDDGDAGDGGAGTASTITGTSIVYAGGGGGALSHLATGTAGVGGDGGGGEGACLGWELYDASSVGRQLSWELFTHGAAHPTTEAGLDALFDGATPVRSGRGTITTQTATGAAGTGTTRNILDWTSTSDLYNSTDVGSVSGDPTDNLAFRVTGRFIPTETGTYTFTVASDDAADVRIGATTVTGFYEGRALGDLGVTQGSISLTAGTVYDLRIRMEEGTGGEGLRMFWRKPSQSTSSDWYQDVDEVFGAEPDASPTDAFEFDRYLAASTRFSVERGLANVTTQSVTTTANTLNWSGPDQLETVLGLPVEVQLGTDTALVVSGTFLPSETGTYTFTLASDDSGELSIDGTAIIADYGDKAAPALGEVTGTVALTAGTPARIRVREHNRAAGGTLRLFWRKPSQTTGWHQDASELTAVGRPGTDGLGSGGGAGGFSGSANADGGDGGDGIVIVRYRHDAA